MSALSAAHVELAGQGRQLVAKEGQLMTDQENTGQLPGFALTTYLVPGKTLRKKPQSIINSHNSF